MEADTRTKCKISAQFWNQPQLLLLPKGHDPNVSTGNSLVVQWVIPHAPTAGGVGSISKAGSTPPHQTKTTKASI